MKLVVGYSTGGDVDCGDHAKSDFGDIRFVNLANDTEYPYWMENYTSDTQATFWIKNTDNADTILMYYGNSGVSTTSNGDNTFCFFDNFNSGSSPDTNKWDTVGTISVDAGYLKLNPSETEKCYGKSAYGVGYSLRWRADVRNDGGGYDQRCMGWVNNYNEFYDYVFMSPHDSGASDGDKCKKNPSYLLQGHTFSSGYKTYEIMRISSTSSKFYENGVLTNSVTSATYNPIISIKPLFYVYTADTDQLWIDWVFVRKCSATEPSWSSFGSEQTQGAGATVPVVTTNDATGVEENNATIRGTLTSDGSVVGSGSTGWNWAEAYEDNNGFANPANVYTDDGTYTEDENGDNCEYKDFDTTSGTGTGTTLYAGIPAGATISGITVEVEARGSKADGGVDVKLSWNGGTSWSSEYSDTYPDSSWATKTYGGSSDTWGAHSWTKSDFSDANFRIWLEIDGAASTLIDYVKIDVSYTALTTTCWFRYGDETPPTDNNVSQGLIANQSSFSYNWQSLTPGKLYYFDTQANNSAGWDTTGGIKSFLTKPDPPSGASASSSSSGSSWINLSWTAGAGADRYYVRYSNTSTPTTRSEGTELCNVTTTYYNSTFSTSGTYYFSIWSYASEVSPALHQWSDTYNSASEYLSIYTWHSESFGGKLTVTLAIDVEINDSSWIAGSLDCGDDVQKNFTFYQNGSATIDIGIGINSTNGNYSFVNYTTWSNSGHDQYCANFTVNTWSSESMIEPGYPASSVLKSSFAPGSFVYGIRLWMPKSVTYQDKQEDFEVVLYVSEST